MGVLTDIDISIVVPLYNEEEVFDKLINRLTSVINTTVFSCEIILVNDGSSDKTDLLIQKVCKVNRFWFHQETFFLSNLLLFPYHIHQLVHQVKHM